MKLRKARSKMAIGIIFLIILLGLGWWAYQARKQATAVALITRFRPYGVRYEGQVFPGHEDDEPAEARAKSWWPPAALERWLGPDPFRDVVEVTIGHSHQPGAPSEDELLEVTTRLRKVKILRIEFDVTDTWAEQLTRLTALEDLVMPQANEGLTDRGMRSIGAIRTLKTLQINHSTVTPAGLAELGNLDRLESLATANMIFEFDDNNVSVRGPSNTDWSPGLAGLARLPHLKVLDLALPYIDGAGLRHLGKIRSLKMLDLDCLSCQDDDFRHLATLPDLQILSLSSTTIDGTGFRHLIGMPRLTHVIVARTPRLADPGIAAIASLPTLETAMLDGSHLTAEGLLAFRATPQLRFLHLEPAVADEGDRLRQALPRCQVQNGQQDMGDALVGTIGYGFELK